MKKSPSSFNWPLRATLITESAYATERNNSNTYRWNAITSVTLGGTTYQALSYWNSAGKLVLSKRVLDGAWTSYTYDGTGGLANIALSGGDNHDVISLGIDPDGFIHVSYDMHAEALKYRKSDAAINSWTGTLTTTLSMVGTNETQVTYPTFINDPSGNLYFIFRDGTSGNGDLYLYKYNHGTTTWAAATGTTAGKVINGKASSVNPYWEHPCFDSNFGSGGFLHIAWHWRSEASGPGENHNKCYVKWDGTNWKKADGTSQTIPVTEANAEIIDTVTPNVGMTSFNSLYSDSNGHPHIVYPKTATNRYLYYAYHNGSSWTVSQLPTRANPAFGDNATSDIGLIPAIAINRTNNTVYVIYEDLYEGGGVWVLKSTDFTTWSKKQIYPYSTGWWSPKFDYNEFERSGSLYFLMEEYYGALLTGSKTAFPIYLWKVNPSIW